MIALYDAGMARLVEKLMAATLWRETVDWAERWIAQGRTPEPAYRALMIAHASLGNLPAALAAYRRCVDALRADLDVTPSPETADLADAIRNSQFTIHHSQFSSSPPPVTPSNLPAQTTPIVGRTDELRALAALLADPQQRLVTIVGPGGMGKTRLALAAAEAQIEHFTHGVFFVPLAAADKAEAIVPAIAAALGFSFQDDRRPAQQQLLDYLRRRRLLLLLDNFEHLLEATPLLIAILEAAPGAQLLVTSRERLRLNAETLLRLDGLDLPPADVDVYAAGSYSAVDLFVENGRRLQRDFAPQKVLLAIAHICRLVGGMPLGILLAASWMDVLTPAEIATEISQNLDFLQAELADLDARHRSLRAVFEQSWRRLSASERTALTALSVFRGEMTREAAEAVTGASLATFLALVNRSLLQRTPAGHFQMHELMRQYAAERLAANPDRGESIHTRHAAFYAKFLAQTVSGLRGGNSGQQLQPIQASVENLRAAWHWASTRKQTHLLDQIVDWLSEFAQEYGRFDEGQADFVMAADLLAGDASVLSTRIRILTHLAYVYHLQGETELFQRTLKMTLALLEEQAVDDHSLPFYRAMLLYLSGNVLLGNNRPEAYRLYMEALALFRACNDPFWTARTLLGVGWVVRHAAAYDELAGVLDECIALCRLHADLGHLFGALELLGFAALEQGRLAEAEEHLAEALATAQRLSSLRAIARSQRSFGILLVLRGRFAEGDEQLAKASAGYQEWGERTGQVFVTTWQAFVRLHQGRYAESSALARAGVEQAQDQNHRGVIANGLLILGELRLAEDDYSGALTLLEESVANYEALQQRHELAIALATLAYAQRRLGNSRGAIATVNRAIQLVTSQAFFPRAVALPLLALLLADQGEIALAVELHAFAHTYPYSRWFYDVVGKQLEAVAASLPPEVVAAAQARGRARELQATTAELLDLLS